MDTYFDMPSMAMVIDLVLERAGAKALAYAAATRTRTNLNMFSVDRCEKKERHSQES